MSDRLRHDHSFFIYSLVPTVLACHLCEAGGEEVSEHLDGKGLG